MYISAKYAGDNQCVIDVKIRTPGHNYYQTFFSLKNYKERERERDNNII